MPHYGNSNGGFGSTRGGFFSNAGSGASAGDYWEEAKNPGNTTTGVTTGRVYRHGNKAIIPAKEAGDYGSEGIYIEHTTSVGEHNCIQLEISDQQLDAVSGTGLNISHHGAGDACYIASHGTSGIGYESALFGGGTRGFIATLQDHDGNLNSFCSPFVCLWESTLWNGGLGHGVGQPAGACYIAKDIVSRAFAATLWTEAGTTPPLGTYQFLYLKKHTDDGGTFVYNVLNNGSTRMEADASDATTTENTCPSEIVFRNTYWNGSANTNYDITIEANGQTTAPTCDLRINFTGHGEQYTFSPTDLNIRSNTLTSCGTITMASGADITMTGAGTLNMVSGNISNCATLEGPSSNISLNSDNFTDVTKITFTGTANTACLDLQSKNITAGGQIILNTDAGAAGLDLGQKIITNCTSIGGVSSSISFTDDALTAVGSITMTSAGGITMTGGGTIACSGGAISGCTQIESSTGDISLNADNFTNVTQISFTGTANTSCLDLNDKNIIDISQMICTSGAGTGLTMTGKNIVCGGGDITGLAKIATNSGSTLAFNGVAGSGQMADIGLFTGPGHSGTPDTALASIGDTSTTNQSANIQDNFYEIMTALNSVRTAMRAWGMMA